MRLLDKIRELIKKKDKNKTSKYNEAGKTADNKPKTKKVKNGL